MGMTTKVVLSELSSELFSTAHCRVPVWSQRAAKVCRFNFCRSWESPLLVSYQWNGWAKTKPHLPPLIINCLDKSNEPLNNIIHFQKGSWIVKDGSIDHLSILFNWFREDTSFNLHCPICKVWVICCILQASSTCNFHSQLCLWCWAYLNLFRGCVLIPTKDMKKKLFFRLLIL